MHDELLGLVGQHQARRADDRALEVVERALLLVFPDERLLRRRALRSLPVLLESAAQLRERRGDLAEVLDESTVVTREADELLDVLLLRGRRPPPDRVDLTLDHAHTAAPHEVAEELNLRAEEVALAELAVEFPLAHAQHDLAQMLLVLLQRPAVDEDVVEEDQHELVELLAEGGLHQRHELGRRVRQPHRQHEPLEVTVARGERGLLDALGRHANLPVAGPQVQLGEIARALQPVEQLVDARQRVAISNRLRVERAVVDHHALRPVRLHDEEHRRAPR